MRKMSGGNRTAAGAHVHEVLTTVGRTAERNGIRLVDVLPALMCSLVAGYVLPLLPGLPSVIEPSLIEDWVHGLAPGNADRRLRRTRTGLNNQPAARSPPS
jgi:hypothetical protein